MNGVSTNGTVNPKGQGWLRTSQTTYRACKTSALIDVTGAFCGIENCCTTI